MSSKFTTVSLDQLINDCTGDASNNFDAEINNALSQYEDNEIAQSVSPELQNLVNQTGNTIDHNKIYNQLAKLIETGNEALANLSAFELDPSNGEAITATASLLNSIKNVVAEFTKIHQQHIKFQQAIELEKLKFLHKQELIKIRAEAIAAAKKSLTNEQTEELPSNTLIQVGDNDLMNFIHFQQDQESIQNKSLSSDLV